MMPGNDLPIGNEYTPTLHGLVCGFAMRPGQGIRVLDGGNELEEALAQSTSIVWLHFNVRIGEARQWIARCAYLPEASRQFLLENDERRRIEQIPDGLLGVISDIRYLFNLDLEFDPEQIASLRFHLDRHCLISTRVQPCSSTDRLRDEMGQGHFFDTSAGMLISICKVQTPAFQAGRFHLQPSSE